MVAQRDVNGRPMPETSVVEEPGTIGEDVRLTIDASLQLALEQELLAAWIADEAKSVSAVVHGPVYGRGVRRGDVPVVRRQRLQGDREGAPQRVHRPGRLERLRARVGVQDDDRGDRARGGTVTRTTPHQGRRHAASRSRRVQDRQRRSQGHGLDHVRGRDRLLAQRRRGQGRAGTRRRRPSGVDDAVRHVAHARLRAEDRHRRRRRGLGQPVRARSERRSRGARSTSPTARSARAWRSRRSSSRRLRGAGQRRHRDPAARRQRRRSARRDRAPAGPGRAQEDLEDPAPHDGSRRRRRSTSIATGRSFPATTSVARRAPPRSGTRRRRTGSTTSSTTRSSDTSAARPARRISSSRSVSRRDARRSPRLGHLEMPVMSFELFRRIATNAITTPDLLQHRTVADPIPVTDR